MPRDAGPPDIDERHRLATIDRATFERVLKHYNSSLFAAVDADGLDQQRYEEIPGAVARRQKEPHLEKEELITLVTWKLFVPFTPTFELPLTPSQETWNLSASAQRLGATKPCP